MNIITRAVEFVSIRYTEIRVRGHARSNAFHQLPNQGRKVIAAMHGNPVADPAQLMTPIVVPDTTTERATVAELGEQLAAYSWVPIALPFALLFFGWIGWRGSSRLFLASGFPSTDAMLLGAMLESFNVFLVWLLHQAWLRPYDGTSRRAIHLALLSTIYLCLVGCMVALRLGQADPNEPLMLRLANAGLIVASVVGPAFAIEVLGRIGYRIAPLLYRRKRATAVIRRAEEAQHREIVRREELVAHNARWTDNASRLESIYEIEYAKSSTRFAKGSA